jgi:hypothetical protein
MLKKRREAGKMMADRDGVIDWLLASDEPWTRYRTRLDLLGEPLDSPAVLADRREMLTHPMVLDLIEAMKHWGERPFTRHNDAGYPIYKLALLAEFGLQAGDPGIDDICQNVMSHQSPEGAFQCLISIPKAFGGDGQNHWTWIICDAPTLLGTLLVLGYQDDPRVKRAQAHLLSLAETNGYRCAADSALGKFRGPGKKDDPCPIANLLALKALSRAPELWEHPIVKKAAEMLLSHWDSEPGRKYYLFGVGTTFRKLKAPLIWYDLLNVCDTLSRFPALKSDARLRSMAEAMLNAADGEGRCTASSMYKSWAGWSFADKKQPSPWLTFLALRIAKRMGVYIS